MGPAGEGRRGGITGKERYGKGGKGGTGEEMEGRRDWVIGGSERHMGEKETVEEGMRSENG